MKHAENSQACSNGVSRLNRDETSDPSGSVSRHQFWKENNNTFSFSIPELYFGAKIQNKVSEYNSILFNAYLNIWIKVSLSLFILDYIVYFWLTFGHFEH